MMILHPYLYLESQDLLDAGWKQNAIYRANERNGKYWQMVPHPQDARLKLVRYDTLRPEHQDKLKEKFGDCWQHARRQPILTLLQASTTAWDWFAAYQYPTTHGQMRHLSVKQIACCANTEMWLRMLVQVGAEKNLVRCQLGYADMGAFYTDVLALLQHADTNLPHTYRHILQRMVKYKAAGLPTCLPPRLGNSNSLKVADATSLAVLLELLKHPHNHDDTVVCLRYNDWAAANGYKAITDGAVGSYRIKYAVEIVLARDGNAAWYNDFGRHILRNRATAAMLLWGSDDNTLDLYFVDHETKNPYARLCLVVVMDASNDYVLGYAYGRTVTTDLIRQAYLNAMHHVHELTGGYYLPHQLQTDRFGVDAKLTNELAMWYKQIAHYTPAKAKAPRGKYIEQAFGTRWHQQLKTYPNYAGHNITAKEKANREHIELAKRTYPMLAEAPRYIADHINALRHLADATTGITRQQQWLTSFEADERSRARPISRLQMLHLFGVAHSLPRSTNRYTHCIGPQGLVLTLHKQVYSYQVPNDCYLDSVGKRVRLVYDPLDMSSVMATNDDGLLLLATPTRRQPGALADYQPGDGERLQKALAEKKGHVTAIQDAASARRALLQQQGIDAQGMLQAGVLAKGLRQQAEDALLGGDDYRAALPLVAGPHHYDHDDDADLLNDY